MSREVIVERGDLSREAVVRTFEVVIVERGDCRERRLSREAIVERGGCRER